MPPLFGPLALFSDTFPPPSGYGTPRYGTPAGSYPAAPVVPGAPVTAAAPQSGSRLFQLPGPGNGKRPLRFGYPPVRSGGPEPVLTGPPVQAGVETTGADQYFGPFNRITLGAAVPGKL